MQAHDAILLLHEENHEILALPAQAEVAKMNARSIICRLKWWKDSEKDQKSDQKMIPNQWIRVVEGLRKIYKKVKNDPKSMDYICVKGKKHPNKNNFGPPGTFPRGTSDLPAEPYLVPCGVPIDPLWGPYGRRNQQIPPFLRAFNRN